MCRNVQIEPAARESAARAALRLGHESAHASAVKVQMMGNQT